MLKFALVGNPNCGKTTLFNSLTGSTAHVGNWPGVTVDKREGTYKKGAEPISIIDLPGIYSMSPYTPEEVIARNYILDSRPDCVINIIDATNLERNLYLTTQIMEIDVPMVIALNMIDAVEKAGDFIDEKLLEKNLGLAVVKVSALKETGLDELMDKALQASKTRREGKTVLENTSISHLIGDVKIALEGQGVSHPLFHAVKLVEQDELEVKAHKDTLKTVEAFKKTFDDETFGDDFDALIADGRYNYITSHFTPAMRRKNPDKFSPTPSDKADKVLTHKIWGIPIFLLILFGIFHLTFAEDFLYLGAIFKLPSLESLGLVVNGEPISYGVRWLACVYDGAVYSPGVIINNIWNEMLVGELFNYLSNLISGSSLAPWAVGLLVDGVISGVGAVLSFLPPILVLFMFFSILEDSGYMARIAFILDKIFRKFGLSGRAFLPMIMGFGCSVPAMINTRTLADEKEKLATVRVIPFFSCGAKLPILTAVAGAIVSSFNIGNADVITYSMYVLGILVALLSVFFMRSTSLKGENPPFIMELPTYRLPQFKSLMLHLWDKAKHFLQKAFTIILLSTIVIWFLTHFSFDWKLLSETQINQSILASVSKLIQPLFTPLGFGSQLGEYGWVFVVAIFAGLIAKENVVATLSTLASFLLVLAGGLNANLGEDGIGAINAIIATTNVSVPALLSFIAFNMLTIPCMAAVATARSEINNSKKFNFTLAFWLAVSYLVSCMVYTIGSWWWTSFIWASALIACITAVVLKNKKRNKKENN